MHVYVVDVRVCVPLVAHAEPTMQADQSVVVVVPHVVPSVLARMHACISGASLVWQVPPMHSELVTTRDCVPARVHGSANAHAVQSPSTGIAHEVPSVLARVHACMLIAVVG